VGLNFPNQKLEIRSIETKVRRWDAVMFDVGCDVLVVRMGAGEGWVVGVRLGIVVVKQTLALPDFVTITDDLPSLKVQPLEKLRADIVGKVKYTSRYPGVDCSFVAGELRIDDAVEPSRQRRNSS